VKFGREEERKRGPKKDEEVLRQWFWEMCHKECRRFFTLCYFHCKVMEQVWKYVIRC
jgi:hypothetical protein